MKIGMWDADCIADNSCEFVEFCKKNHRVIAKCIGQFLPARIFFGCSLERAWKGGGVMGGTVADLGVCQAYLPSRVANLVFKRCGNQFGRGQIKICGLYLARLENNCKCACKLAIFTVSHDYLPLLVCRLKTAGSLCRLDRWCFWIRNICGKKVTTGMPDDNCIADISLRFGEFCTKNGGVIAQRIGPFLPARLLFWFRSGQVR